MSWNYNVSKLEKNSFVLIKQSLYSKKKIEEFEFMYQPKLDLKIPFQYGIELEFSDASINEIKKALKDFQQVSELCYGYDWYVDIDESVTDYIYGGELKSPISYNTEIDWYTLKEICNIVTKLDASINSKCSVHIHVDFNKLNYPLEVWDRFLRLWSAYEDVFFEFSRVGQEEIRGYIKEYARPIRDVILKEMEMGKAIDALSGIVCSLDKSYCLNMKRLHHSINGVATVLPTIEFRSCNGTLDPILIQNIVRLFAKVLESCKMNSKKVEECITKRLYEIESDIYEKELELADLVFSNDLEKLSFLKQCLMKEKTYTLKNNTI